MMHKELVDAGNGRTFLHEKDRNKDSSTKPTFSYCDMWTNFKDAPKKPAGFISGYMDSYSPRNIGFNFSAEITLSSKKDRFSISQDGEILEIAGGNRIRNLEKVFKQAIDSCQQTTLLLEELKILEK